VLEYAFASCEKGACRTTSYTATDSKKTPEASEARIQRQAELAAPPPRAVKLRLRPFFRWLSFGLLSAAFITCFSFDEVRSRWADYLFLSVLLILLHVVFNLLPEVRRQKRLLQIGAVASAYEVVFISEPVGRSRQARLVYRFRDPVGRTFTGLGGATTVKALSDPTAARGDVALHFKARVVVFDPENPIDSLLYPANFAQIDKRR